MWRRPGGLIALLVVVGAGLLLVTGGRTQQPAGEGAVARIRGGPLAPQLEGTVRFRPAPGGTLAAVSVSGLPAYRPGSPPIGPHGFHLHEVGSCRVGNPGDPFQDAGGHFNPTGAPHGNHAGDFPVLFSNGGRAEMSFFTDRFRPSEIVGRAIIIHENPDDYRSQPAGSAGRRLGCGVVESE